MISSRSVWVQSSLPAKLVAGGIVIVGFTLLFLVEYNYGNSSGLLKNVIWALAPSAMFALSMLFLSVGLTSMQQERISWYKQQSFLMGIGFVFLAFSFLITFGTINHILPPLLALFLDSVCAVLAFVCIILSTLVHQRKQ